jgi:two-component system OmpR family sensor kinase
MSLRARLALFYTSIVGGILLLFGLAIYGAVSFSLISHIDDTLNSTYSNIVPSVSVDTTGQLTVISSTLLDLSPGVIVQVWGRGSHLRFSNPSSFSQSLDSVGLDSRRPIYRDVYIKTSNGSLHLRVLTVPLVSGGGDRIVGAIQVATYLAVVDATQQTLLIVLVLGAVLAMAVAGFAGWFSTRQALAPLGDVTKTALQITRADDLSRRIPYKGPPDDEVGQLIHAFNQTLSRLENLFNTQRRFLADVGHELRTPLTVIKGNVDLMRRMNTMDIESMDSIESEVDRLTRMVGDLLLLAQAESGKLPLDRRMIELDTLLLEVLQQMRVLARDRLGLRIGEIDQVLICGDNDRIKQVLVNLISNAIKYTPKGGEVVVGLGKLNNQARVTVSDNGPGIPPEDLPHIFERFYRGEKSRTRQHDGKGFGLGLSIAYWIVRNHGGTIEVDSQPGQGTTFCVWLPLSEGDCKEES